MEVFVTVRALKALYYVKRRTKLKQYLDTEGNRGERKGKDVRTRQRRRWWQERELCCKISEVLGLWNSTDGSVVKNNCLAM